MISSITNTNTYICFLCASFLCLCFLCCSANDNITTGDIIHDGADYLESPGKKFQMGFFGHQMASEERYVGIWYAIDPKTVVWVANRDRPVPDSTGVLTIADGEVKVLDKNQTVYFYTTTGGDSLKATLKLLDSGNAVLIDIASGSIKWQSFLHPTDTFLPGMKMDLNLKLTSWKSEDDPGTGIFEFLQEETRQYVIMNNNISTPQWKSGSGSMKSFDPNQNFNEAYYLLSNSSTQPKNTSNCKSKSSTRNKNLIYCGLNSSNSVVFKNYSRLLMNYTGHLQHFSWAEGDKQWVVDWQEPKDSCSVYGVCGKFGQCSLSSYPTCSCLPGFEPIAPGHDSVGCKRTSEICQNNDKFEHVSMITVENPTLPLFESNNDSDCKGRCLQICRCQAYSYIPAKELQLRGGRPSGTNSCWIWDSELNNLRTNGPHNISIRVPEGYLNSAEGSPPDISSSSRKETHILIFAMTILVILLLCSLSYIYYKRPVAHEQGRNSMLQTDNSERRAIDILELDHSREEDTEGIGVPFFEIESILAATDNFSDVNKLGQGGFGPVYKGKLPGGLEVAVKRLSSLSGQGLEEFRNEVILIAKLQHRNLVRLLGYCMKGNEKMLLYEYMPNKSLDAFIFDRAPSLSLDWAKRYEIIMGIARGLLYLHQDSRLRIIHRDLLDFCVCKKIQEIVPP